MKFTELRKSVDALSDAKQGAFHRQYLSTEYQVSLERLQERYLAFLTEDLLDAPLSVDLKQWLSPNYYRSSNEHARDCLELCFEVAQLYGRRIKPWTDSALKCYDNFLLKHIQEDRKEQLGQPGARVRERDVYAHLMALGAAYQEIGQAFHNIYQLRNQFQHIQVRDERGHLVPQRQSQAGYNRQRDQILAWFREALRGMVVWGEGEINF
jgi:hypothetical protein